jgi:hypothetical protein
MAYICRTTHWNLSSTSPRSTMNWTLFLWILLRNNITDLMGWIRCFNY